MSNLFALFMPEYRHLMRPNNEDVNKAYRDIIDNKNSLALELTFNNVLVESLKNCLARHVLVVDINQFLSNGLVREAKINYQSEINLEMLSNSFKAVNSDKSVDTSTDELGKYLKIFN